jgi:23S rRNA pseudouridine2605 synthase
VHVVRPSRHSSPGRKTNIQKKVGLARALSKLGYCSRSQAAVLIRDGSVTLNGRVERDPEMPVSLGRDRIAVQGRSVAAARKIYLILNKPRGVVTTAADEKGRDTVYSLLPTGWSWLAPVGRLDKASEGLLLLTNDSEWGARVMDPETHVDKTYHVQVNRVADGAMLDLLARGVEMPTGETLRAKEVRVLRAGEKNSWLEIVLDQGKNRQIRRMLDALEVAVLRLVRVAIGPLHLGELAKGQYRELSAEEKRALDRAIP